MTTKQGAGSSGVSDRSPMQSFFLARLQHLMEPQDDAALDERQQPREVKVTLWGHRSRRHHPPLVVGVSNSSPELPMAMKYSCSK